VDEDPDADETNNNVDEIDALPKMPILLMTKIH
jgi:hypothetical protein